MKQVLSHDADCRHPDCCRAEKRLLQARQAVIGAESRCKQAGLRLTPIRRDVLETLCGAVAPLGAYDLVQRLSERQGRRIAPISVYRALDFLVEQGLVHRLNTRNAYIACNHGHGADETIAFMICETCGGVNEDGAPAIGAALLHLAAGRHFQARQQTIEITGLCAHCQAA